MSHVLYMIESEPALSLVKHHIAEVRRVRKENQAMADEIGGVTQWRIQRSTGEICAVDFEPGKHHPQFKKPTKWGSYPKKGSEWAKRFSEQNGHEMQSSLIAEAFGVPLSISFKKESGHGWRCIGTPLNECGFLYLSADGPYALWIPDVAEEVAKDEAQGYVVGDKIKNFSMELPGCRRIEQEEWEILVAQDALEKKRAARLAQQNQENQYE